MMKTQVQKQYPCCHLHSHLIPGIFIHEIIQGRPRVFTLLGYPEENPEIDELLGLPLYRFLDNECCVGLPFISSQKVFAISVDKTPETGELSVNREGRGEFILHCSWNVHFQWYWRLNDCARVLVVTCPCFSSHELSLTLQEVCRYDYSAESFINNSHSVIPKASQCEICWPVVSQVSERGILPRFEVLLFSLLTVCAISITFECVPETINADFYSLQRSN